MSPVDLPGANDFSADVPGVIKCAIIRGTDVKGFPFIMAGWRPNMEDLISLNDGGFILLKVLGTQLPPMTLFTVDKDNEPNI